MLIDFKGCAIWPVNQVFTVSLPTNFVIPGMRIIVLLLLVIHTISLMAQTTDAKGRKQGYWKKTDDKNKLVYEGEFRDDKPVGKFKYYYPNDSVRAILKFSGDGKTAYAKLFHPGGKRMAEGKYLNKEIKDSTWLYYDELGALISKDNYKMGIKNGVCYVYLPDGKVAEERSYQDDKKHGYYKEYFNDGAIKSKGAYEGGVLEGRVSYFYPNGVEVAAGFYKNGLRNGPWIYKTESGKIREKELYKNGQTATAKETEEFFAKNKITEQPVKSSKTKSKQTPVKKGVRSPETSHE